MSSPGVIFDFDGVIVDSEELQLRAYAHVLEPYGVRIGREEYGREWIGRGNGPEYAVRRYELPISPDELRAVKSPVYRELLHERADLMPGAAEAVDRLARHFPLAVATNSTAEETTFVLERFGLRQHFRALVTRERYERAKPQPDAFLAAAHALDRPPPGCVVLEDAYKGVLAAHRAGCPCVAIPHDLTRSNDFSLATRIVGNITQVTAELIRELARPE